MTDEELRRELVRMKRKVMQANRGTVRRGAALQGTAVAGVGYKAGRGQQVDAPELDAAVDEVAEAFEKLFGH